MSFPGFTADDFAVFTLPDFAARMSALRERVRTKLVALSEQLAPRLTDASGHLFYPHVAQHARRRTNPPDDTWAAFARSPRGYKRYAHLTVGVQATGAYVRLVLKADSADKKAAAAALARHGADVLHGLAQWPNCYWYDSDHPTSGTPVADVSEASLMLAAARLDQRKTAAIATGFELSEAESVIAGDAFVATALARCLALIPLYEALTGQQAGA